jgi:hypothetical protein
MATDDDAANDDDALEGERYQSVRDLFRQARTEGFDEDPPARIDALLMAAARQHAPEPRAGALERFRRWMVATLMQPAVAGAVAVAVIGGAAGVLYIKNNGRVSEPTVRGGDPHAAIEPQRPLEAPALPSLKDDVGDLPALETATTGSAAASSAAGSDEIQARLREQMAQEENQRRLATERRDRPQESGPGGGGVRAGGDSGDDDTLDPFAKGEGTTQFDYKPDGRDTATVIATGDDTGGGGGGGQTGGVVGGVKSQITSPRPPPDGTASSDDEILVKEQEEASKNLERAPETTASGRTGSTRPSNRTQAENLLRQARTAAKKKDCPTVRTMAKRAKQLDATYYASTFSRDAAVKDCL